MAGQPRQNEKIRRIFLAVVLLVTLFALLNLSQSSASTMPRGAKLSASTTTAGPGYYLAGSGGATYAFGAPSYGSTYTYGLTGLSGAHPLNAPIVGMAAVPNGGGYWLVAADGGVFDFGDANFYGSTYTYGLTGLSGAHPLNAPIVGMAAVPNGGGYWLVAADGGVFDFGDANFYGSTYTYGLTGLSGAHPLNAPIVAIIPTPNGKGYWLISKDGGVFDFGDANFYGSTYTYGLTGLSGAHPLNAPIVGGIATEDGQGYWLVAADGGVFDFGDANFYGSTYTYGLTGLSGAHPLAAPIVGMAAVPNGGGYWLVAADGGVFDFGDANFHGSLGAQKISAPIVAIAVAGQSKPTISTTALPGAIVGQPYTDSIDVTGGDGPVTVTATGLPSGLTLTPNGTLEGTPDTAGLAFITVTATDTQGTTSKSIELSVTNPLQGQLASATPQASSNWAGYYVEPGSFDAITGTFTVPSLSANQPAYCDSGQTTPGCSLSEWVGIDGATNTSLIQAGVELTPQGAGSTYQIYPWWEILPNVQTNVNSLSVNSGNQVTVNIFKTMNANNWEIQIINDTTGASFTTTQPYSGPGASAEWIAEAPSTTSDTILEVPTLNTPVSFTNLGIGATGSISDEVQTYLCQVLPVQPGTLTNDSFQITQLSGAAESGPCSNGAFLNATAVLHE